ncbi:MAG: PDZ domain-containing protein [Aquificae bacterium]|nr:PDZ domain-containing protein [Aquificota bacterium]
MLFAVGVAVGLIVDGILEKKLFTLPPEVEVKIQPHKREWVNTAYIKQLFNYREETKKEEKEQDRKQTETTNQEEYTVPVKDIKLLGIITVGNRSYALMEINGRKVMVSTGERVGDYKVVKIHKYKVILLKDGSLYSVSISPSERGLSDGRNKGKQTEERYRYTLDRDEVKSLTKDLGRIFKKVAVIPVVKNGETQGYKLRYVSPRSVLYKYGFRTGDIIVAVNGMPVKTPEEAFKVYSLIRNEPTVRVKVIRNGEEKEILYEIR